MTEEEKISRLTPAMRWVLIGVGAVVVIGAIVVGWLLTSAESNGGGGSASGSVTPTQGPLPDATPTSGSEVLPPTGSAENVIPPLTPAEPETPAAPVEPAPPLISPPFPGTATADGGLVAGFPTDVMGPLPNSDVIQTAIASEGDVMQVTLIGRTDASADDVRAAFAGHWAELGLTDQGSTDGGVSFAGRSAVLSLTFSSAGTGTRYTVFGIFRAG